MAEGNLKNDSSSFSELSESKTDDQKKFSEASSNSGSSLTLKDIANSFSKSTADTEVKPENDVVVDAKESTDKMEENMDNIDSNNIKSDSPLSTSDDLMIDTRSGSDDIVFDAKLDSSIQSSSNTIKEFSPDKMETENSSEYEHKLEQSQVVEERYEKDDSCSAVGADSSSEKMETDNALEHTLGQPQDVEQASETDNYSKSKNGDTLAQIDHDVKVTAPVSEKTKQKQNKDYTSLKTETSRGKNDVNKEKKNKTSIQENQGNKKYHLPRVTETAKDVNSQRKHRRFSPISFEAEASPRAADHMDYKDRKKEKKPKNRASNDLDIIDNRHKYQYFWRNYSPFSQWYFCVFYVNDVKYNCAEQFMMHRKAELFEDHQSAKKILETKEPKQQKALGRKVKNFDQELWDANCIYIVEEGNEAKFSQNDDLKNILYESYPKRLVEASPVDRIWGIGLSKDNPLAWDESTWKGKNLLGEALTRVRHRMMEKDGLLGQQDSEK